MYAKGHFNHLKTLVRASTNKNPQDPNDNSKGTLLHKAARDRKLEFVQFLVPLLSDKNPKDKDGWTPLHGAAGDGHLEIVKYFCDQLQDKNPKSNNGKTEVVKYLVSVVDDKHPKDGDGETPLDWARRRGHTEIVNILGKY